ncbi:MAG: V-type ATP synthase subunit K [bacterium]
MGWGLVLAILGAALAVILAGFGSSIGISIAAQPCDGLLSENPEAFGNVLILAALPGTQGIYGFVSAFFAIIQLGLLTGKVPQLTVSQGMQFLGACLPVGFGGLVSGIYQGKVSAAGVAVAAKQPGDSMKAVILSALVETYAILGLLATILLLMGIKI